LCCYKAEFYSNEDPEIVVVYSTNLEEISLHLEEYQFSMNKKNQWYWKKYFQIIND
jgi:hypothetical protein